MRWARVDAVTGRVVVRFDPVMRTVDDLVEGVAAAEQAAGVRAGDGHADVEFPGDAGPVAAEGWALAADVAGLAAAVAGQLGPV